MKSIIFIVFLALTSGQIHFNNDIGRIIGGEEASENQFPYQIGMIVNMGFSQQFCGGSLISDEWIVTAAHCLDGADSALIILGAHNFREDIDAQRFYVNKNHFIIHEEWSASGLVNDIALIHLPEPAEIDENIKPISLPPRSLAKIDLVGKEMITSGWGKTLDKETGPSDVLRYVKLPVLIHWRCNIRYLFNIKDTNICTEGSGGKSICSGDSGGPLVYNLDGTRTLVGVTSFGLKFGCELGWPGVFTRITSYLDWISKHTNIKIQD